MVDTITKKIADLKNQLASQVFTSDDKAEIDKVVEEYRKELTDEKNREYEYNAEIIKSQIAILEEVRNEELDKQAEEDDDVSGKVDVTVPVNTY